MPWDSPPSEKSSKLIQSANPVTKNKAEPSYASYGDPKNIGKVECYIKLDLDRLNQSTHHILNDCATLAIQDYAIQNSQNWRQWHLLKIVEAIRVRTSGHVYDITFEAVNGHGVNHTFEADVWDNARFGRRINGFRTLQPRSKWYCGNLWIPLTRIEPPSTRDLGSFVPGSGTFIVPIPKPKYDLLAPPKLMGEDSRNMYKRKKAKKSDKIPSLGSDLFNLELDKLSDNDIGNLKDCATLAMHDHLIQTLNLKWREDSARTLEAEVFDGTDQRRVLCLMAIKPHITEWYLGNLWIPI